MAGSRPASSQPPSPAENQVTVIHVAASYACRRRNNARSGKLSEHARGNAIDMSGFSFARSDAVVVGGGWGDGLLASIGLSKSGSFLGDIRKDACSYFTTVLGPGSDRYHGDHFHVDVLDGAADTGFANRHCACWIVAPACQVLLWSADDRET